MRSACACRSCLRGCIHRSYRELGGDWHSIYCSSIILYEVPRHPFSPIDSEASWENKSLALVRNSLATHHGQGLESDLTSHAPCTSLCGFHESSQTHSCHPCAHSGGSPPPACPIWLVSCVRKGLTPSLSQCDHDLALQPAKCCGTTEHC